MMKLFRIAGQVAVLSAFMVLIGYFSSRPTYRQVDEGMAQIKLSFAHGGARKIDCRRLTSEEIAKLPPNERRPNTCSRERIPVHVQLVLDGTVIFDKELSPTGLSSDGPSRAYTKLIVQAGDHVITARMRDSKREDGFDYETRHEVALVPFQNLAIDFKADAGGFIFR